MLPDLHRDFSRGRSGGLVFPSLSEFSTVYCDPHKGFGRVNKAKIDVFLEFSCFFNDPTDVANLISDSSAFSKTSLNKSLVAFNFIENNFVSLYCNSYHISMHLIRQWNWWVFVAILMLKLEEKKQHFSILWFIISKKIKTQKKICEDMEKILWLIEHIKSGLWSFLFEISSSMMLHIW